MNVNGPRRFLFSASNIPEPRAGGARPGGVGHPARLVSSQLLAHSNDAD